MKFIYLADTHIGGRDDEGYRKQPRYLSRFHEVLDGLGTFIEQSGDIDFIIHGGDMVDLVADETIREASGLFGQLPCPTYLALGNHDLTAPDSVESWLRGAPQFFMNGQVDFRLRGDGVQIDVAACNWCETARFWDPAKPQIPWLSPAQWERFSDVSSDCVLQIVVTHAPSRGMPPEQYGGATPMHAPAGDYAERLCSTAKGASLFLGAHTHMNMAWKQDGQYHVTASALTETPFEFKIVEARGESLSMRTASLSSMVSFRPDYDFDATHVQGRPCDRRFTENASCE